MSHPQQLVFVTQLRAAFPEFFTSARVLEVGSLDINGSIRKIFEGAKIYVGLDVGPGPGVDVVCQGQDYGAPSDSFDTVISCEVMEHNPYWAATLANMVRLCRPGSLLIVTCATTGRREHGTTRTIPDNSPLTIDIGWEYYRNLTARDVLQALPLDQMLEPFAFFVNWSSPDLYLIGFKRGLPAPNDADRHIPALQRYYQHVNLHPRCLVVRLLFQVFGEELVWMCRDKFRSRQRIATRIPV